MAKRANKKDIAVIGIGRFGASVVEQLFEMKRYVMAMDSDENNLTQISRIANQTAIVDGADIEGLRALGVDKFDTVIVGVTNNIEIIANLLEIGVKHIIAKARSKRHERVLRQIGVDIIVRPEAEAGIRTAIIATSPSFIKYSEDLQEVGDGYAIGTTIVTNPKWIGKELKNMNLVSLGLSIVSISRNDKVHLPEGSYKIQDGDKVTFIGKITAITKIFEDANDFKKTIEIKKTKQAK